MQCWCKCEKTAAVAVTGETDSKKTYWQSTQPFRTHVSIEVSSHAYLESNQNVPWPFLSSLVVVGLSASPIGETSSDVLSELKPGMLKVSSPALMRPSEVISWPRPIEWCVVVEAWRGNELLVFRISLSFVLSPPKSRSAKPPTFGKASTEVVSSNEKAGPSRGLALFSLFSKLVPKSSMVNPILFPRSCFREDDCEVCWLDADCSEGLCRAEDRAAGRSLLATTTPPTCSSSPCSSPKTECSGSARSGGSGCSSFLRCSNSTTEDLLSSSSFASGFLKHS